ncbi:hypothetical protein CK203_091836 [Vitis vinifera]|uniref:Uncharacterized protein n=1 Tax=Vitis vinifera TaxID=29760 RepID=A0A438BLX0_VITVI|nr:hypothetical protein CK203_091836 [Vitis vinifera]
MLLFLLKGSKMKDEAIESVSAGLSYSIEIKDAYIPPWIISTNFVCAHSFTTEPTSTGLNAAVETVGLKADTQAATGEAIQESTRMVANLVSRMAVQWFSWW